MPHTDPYTVRFQIEGHEIRAQLKELLGTDQLDINNNVGTAARKARQYNPGLAEAALVRAGIETLYIDGKPRKFVSAMELPMYWDDNLEKSMVDILLGHILKLRSARFLLRKPEYRDVFEQYVEDEEELASDLDPTESPSLA